MRSSALSVIETNGTVKEQISLWQIDYICDMFFRTKMFPSPSLLMDRLCYTDMH